MVEVPPICTRRGIGRARNHRGIGLLHGELGAAGGNASAAAVAQISRDLVGARLQSGGVNLGGSAAAGDFHSGAGPVRILPYAWD